MTAVSCDCWSVLAPLNALQINSLFHHLIQRAGREGRGVEGSGVEWSGVEWSGVEWSGVEWSGVEWSGVEWRGGEGRGGEGRGGEWKGGEGRGGEGSGVYNYYTKYTERLKLYRVSKFSRSEHLHISVLHTENVARGGKLRVSKM